MRNHNTGKDYNALEVYAFCDEPFFFLYFLVIFSQFNELDGTDRRPEKGS